MRRLIYLFFALSLLFSCAPSVVVEQPEEVDVKLSNLIGTKASSPLEDTIWEYNTGEKFNQYLWFHGNDVNLFYGLFEDGEIRRYSDFYSSSYKLDGDKVTASVSYPRNGKKEITETLSLIFVKDMYELNVDGASYKYVSSDPSSLAVQWMYIYVNIAPWIM